MRGNPRRGFPRTPSCALLSNKRIPRSAERGQGRRPWTLPAFLKKSGAKNFTQLLFRRLRKMDFEKIKQAAEGYKLDMVRFLREMISHPSESCEEREVVA